MIEIVFRSKVLPPVIPSDKLENTKILHYLNTLSIQKNLKSRYTLLVENKIKIIILAAGKGTRMESPYPKVLAPLKGEHMIDHLLKSVTSAAIDPMPVIVVGYEKDLVIKELGDKYTYVNQAEQLGTGHAVYMAKDACKDAEHVIVISGDQPFIKTETIQNLLNKHLNSGATVTFTTTTLPDFEDWRKAFLKFGRVLKQDGKIIIREYKDATDKERAVKELNTSCYAFKASWLWENFNKTTNINNAQKEYYLTDLLQIAGECGEKIESINIEPIEALGANTKEELEILENMLKD